MASAYGRPRTQTNTSITTPQSRLNTTYPNIPSRTAQSDQSDKDYLKIRPFIPERTSSNPQQISKIVNALNYDVSQIRPFAQGRLRSNCSSAHEQQQLPNVNINHNNIPASNRQTTNNNYGVTSSANSNSGNSEAAAAPGSGSTAPPAGVLTYDWAHMPISPRTKSTDGGWKLGGKRVHQLQEQSHSHYPAPYHQHPPQYYSQYQPHSLPHKRLQRIQVTTDSQTFHSLTVTDLVDSTAIKENILKKLNLGSGDYLYYHENGDMYQHENGERFYAPLSDEEIVNICRKSDERPKDQISVISIDQLAPPYALDGRGIYPDIPSNYGYNRHQGSTVTMIYPHQNSFYGHSGTPITQEGYDPQFTNVISSSPKLIPTTPRSIDAHSLDSDIPPSFPCGTAALNEESRDDSDISESSSKRLSGRSIQSLEAHQQSIPNAHATPVALSAELWAVRPQQQSAGDLPEPRQQKPPVSLWAIPPRQTCEDETEEVKKPVSLWAVPPQKDQGPKDSNTGPQVKPCAAPSLWAVPPQHSSDLEGECVTPKKPLSSASSLWAIPPQRLSDSEDESPTPAKVPLTGSSLWAVPPQQLSDSEGDRIASRKTSSSGSSLWAIPPQRSLDSISKEESSSGSSLWAIPPQKQEHIQLSDPSIPAVEIETKDSEGGRIKAKQFEILSLWTRPSSDSGGSANDEAGGAKSDAVSLWAVPPKHKSVGKEQDTINVKESKDVESSLWAVPHDENHAEVQEAKPTPEMHEKGPSVSLWAVPPKKPSSNSATIAEEVSNSNSSSIQAPTSLWAVPPGGLSLSDRSVDDSIFVNPISGDDSAAGGTGTHPTPLSAYSDNAPYGELWPVDDTPDDSIPAYSKAELSTRFRMNPGNGGTRKNLRRHRRQLSDARSISADNSDQDTASRRQVRFSQATPYSTIEDGVEKLSLRDEPVENRSRNNKDLQIQIPHTDQELHVRSPRTPRQKTPLSAAAFPSPTSALQDPTDAEDAVWGERPSVERLYRDIDKYLPGHDLDKEIFIEANGGTTTSPAPRRLVGHKKSIRVVAKEAHSNWRQAMNVIRVNNRLRRRNTKMWGSKVEQVKPGMELVEQIIIKDVNGTGIGKSADSNWYCATYSRVPTRSQQIAPTKMQWVRGELIGRGSFGRVYHALNVAAGEWIALKEVDVPKTKSDMLNDKMKESIDSLYREVSLLKDFDHENIVQYLGYDYDEEQGHIHIFLEYVPGGSILSVLNKVGKFDEVLVRYFTRQILLGLEYLHDRNVMHRDIKAGNILVDNNGICKIADFGLSKPSGQEEVYNPNANTMMKGTIFWMAPEVVKGSTYSAKIDIWSLGCTVIEMLTGSHPWLDLNMLAALYNLGKYQAPPLPEGASESAKDFLTMCFTINPEDRPTAADLLVHPFVRQEPSFNFKNYMRELEPKS
ncbi:hypothetical protein BX666DRAFT_1887848 [Dichotomocladium elegans]|nr:hypothetical protein BX666DRAFT_1887848 [Dichotomocladium elegans]